MINKSILGKITAIFILIFCNPFALIWGYPILIGMVCTYLEFEQYGDRIVFSFVILGLLQTIAFIGAIAYFTSDYVN